MEISLEYADLCCVGFGWYDDIVSYCVSENETPVRVVTCMSISCVTVGHCSTFCHVYQ